MADEEKRRLVLTLDLHQEVGHGSLHRYVQRRDRLIRHHDPRVPGKGAGDPDALFLPARQLARHPVGKGTGQLHQIKQFHLVTK